MKNVIMVGAPHHLRYLKDISRVFSVPENEFYVFYFSNKSLALPDFINANQFKVLHELYEYSLFNFKGFKTINEFYYLLNSYFDSSDEINLFCSVSFDYSQLFRMRYRKTHLYLLDDGFGVFSNISFFKRFFRVQSRMLMLSVLSRKRYINPFDFKYLTEHSFLLKSNNDCIIYERDSISMQKKSIDENVIYILGVLDVEMGDISLEGYLLILKKIIHDFPFFKIKYYAHRRELLSKLDLITQIGIQVIKSAKPIEFYLSETKHLPTIIIGFKSSNGIFELMVRYNFKTRIWIIDNLKNHKSRIVKEFIEMAYSTKEGKFQNYIV